MKRQLMHLLSKLSFVQQYFSGEITIFMLHRVNYFEANKLLSNEILKVSPQFLDKFIINLKSNGYDFITLDDVYEILLEGKKVDKKIVLTLDDGYKDNYEIAYPIFKKHNIPFAIYLTTSFPEKKAILWWYILEDLIVQKDLIELSDGRTFKCYTKAEKEKTFLKLRNIILTFEKENFLNSLERLFPYYEIDWIAKTEALCLNWDEIVALSQDDLCTIAGHTKNHFAFNQLSEDEIIDEIVDANKLIEEKTGKKIEHFAYPFGSRHEVNQREVEIVKKLAFKTATTIRRGPVYRAHKNHLMCLPRIMLTENFDMRSIGRIRRQRIVTL